MGIFKRIVDEEIKGNRYLTGKLIKDSLDYIRNKGIKKINFDEDSRELVDFLKTREKGLDILVSPETKSLYFLPMNFETGLF